MLETDQKKILAVGNDDDDVGLSKINNWQDSNLINRYRMSKSQNKKKLFKDAAATETKTFQTKL